MNFLKKNRSTMKLKSFLLALGLLTFAVACNNAGQDGQSTDEADQQEMTEAVSSATMVNYLTNEEKADGWMLLFDGESTDGWRNYAKETFPDGWEIVDYTLHCPGSGRGEAGGKDRGDIIYGDKMFANFHLKLEWKISEGGNSGIFYLGQESDDYDYIWKTAPEMQILDNERHPDAQAGKDGNRQAGSLYDLVPAKPQNAKPAGEWNTAEVKVYKGSVWHIQNGETVVEYHLWTPEWEKMVADSKFPALNESWVEVASEGFIGLQDHGDDVWFRNIKIKEL
jgi:hypothetical protein